MYSYSDVSLPFFFFFSGLVGGSLTFVTAAAAERLSRWTMMVYFNLTLKSRNKETEATGERGSWFIHLHFVLLQDSFIRNLIPEFETFKPY